MTSNGACATCLLLHGETRRKANPEETRAYHLAYGPIYRDANRETLRAKGRAYSKAHQPQSAAARRRGHAKQLASKLAARIPDPSDYTGPVITRKAAKAQGLMQFYTGKPCVRDHLSERVTSNGSCLQCNAEDWERFSHIRRARECNAEGQFSLEEVKELFGRQDGRCAYCKTSIADGYQIDHVIALARGGTNWIDNIALACTTCNRRKGTMTATEFLRRLIVKPRKPPI